MSSDREDYSEQLKGFCAENYAVASKESNSGLRGVEIENDEVPNLLFRTDDRLEVVQNLLSRNQVPTLNAKITAEST